VEREICPVWGDANKESAVFGGAREGCISVLNVVFVSVCFEVGVSIGSGFALYLWDECGEPCPSADRRF
jgi:hypothetical protein